MRSNKMKMGTKQTRMEKTQMRRERKMHQRTMKKKGRRRRKKRQERTNQGHWMMNLTNLLMPVHLPLLNLQIMTKA